MQYRNSYPLFSYINIVTFDFNFVKAEISLNELLSSDKNCINIYSNSFHMQELGKIKV